MDQSDSDKRRFPRVDHVTSEQIVRLDPDQTPQKNLILTKNFSASGFRFTTHEKLMPSTYFLIYLNFEVVKELNKDHKNWLRSGDYYLTRVVWIKKIPDCNLFEVGASFLEKNECKVEQFEKFTELLNVNMLDKLTLLSKDL